MRNARPTRFTSALAALPLLLSLAAPLDAAQRATPAPRAVEQPAPVATPAPVPPLPPADPRFTPVVRVVQEAAPAVVSITTTRPAGPAGSSVPAGQGPEAQSMGTGVIIDGAKGYVLTNAHVISGATGITARLHDGREYAALPVGADQDMDLAVLRLDLPPQPTGPGLPQARMGDSDDLMIGEQLVVIGNPFGLSHSVSTGVLSAVDRSVNLGQQTIAGLLQTDAAINPGNSGGPVLNILGQVVGISAAVYARGGGLGFAIPINKAKRVLDELISTGRVAHVWLGVFAQDMSPEQARQFGLPRAGGLVVTDVVPGAPADLAGIRAGDAILAVSGRRVQDKAQYLGLLRNASRGESVGVLLSRAGRELQVVLTPQLLDREAGLSLIAWRWGLSPAQGDTAALAGAKPDVAASFSGGRGPDGVSVLSVLQGGPADRAGLRPGDVIRQVGGLRTMTEADLLSAFTRYRLNSQIILTARRGGQANILRLVVPPAEN